MSRNFEKYFAVLFFGTLAGAAVADSFLAPFIIGFGCLGIFYMIEHMARKEDK